LFNLGIIRGRKIMDIDVVDSNLCDNGFLAHQRRLHPNAVLAESVPSMIEGILRRLGTDGVIGRLRIFGHAGAGEQGMGNSEVTMKDEQLIQIDSRGHLTNRAQLVRLCGRFAPNAVVELHGCQVARNRRGRDLLRQLSHLWQVTVRGGVRDQNPDARDAFEGPYLEARPERGQGQLRRIEQ
jgi:hypothetical protein